MNSVDCDKLARECWDATNDEVVYEATTMDHQLRLCTIVGIISEKLEQGAVEPLTTNSVGLEEFEAEVIRRLTALAPVIKELEPEFEAEPEPAPKPKPAPKAKSVKGKKTKKEK